MLSLIKRHLLYTVRDRVAFAMSFLSVGILIIVYKAFLGDTQVEAIKTATHQDTLAVTGTTMVNFWLVAGIVVVTATTSAISAMGVVVDDQESGKFRDFQLSGSSHLRLMSSYYFAALILSVTVTIASFVVGVCIFIGTNGFHDLSLQDWGHILVVIVTANIFAILLAMLVITFLKSRNGFVTFSTIAGTLIGFLAGVYMAIGTVSTTIKDVMLSLPFVHQTSLLRQVVMPASEKAFFINMPAAAQQHYDQTYGNQLVLSNGHHVSFNESLMVVVAWIGVLVIINVMLQKMILKRK